MSLARSLNKNALCGIDRFGRGTYTAEGIKAVADALRVSGSLTSLNLKYNDVGAEGAKAIADALRDNGSLTSLDLEDNGIGQEPRLGDEAKAALREAVKGRDGFSLVL